MLSVQRLADPERKQRFAHYHLAESELSAQDLQDVEKALPDVLRDTAKTEGASLKMNAFWGS
jgi:hypothetical protein